MTFTTYSGQAYLFARRQTATKWAKKCKGIVLKIGHNGYVVYTKDKGWVKRAGI